MWKQLLQGTEWSQLRDLVSPTFFEVLPAGRLASQVGELAGNYGSRGGFRETWAAREAALEASPVEVVLDDGARRGGIADAEREGEARARRGQRVLELYFHQLYAGDRTLLDLRPERFTADDGDGPLRWRPAAMWLRWADDFLPAVRDLYAGFYGDDDARFRGALEALSITAAEDVFRRQFGEGDQHAVAFHVPTFRETFHEAFIRCRDAGAQLHGNFVALGIYLATLYVHLEALGGTFDVRTAYFRGREGAAAD